MKNIKTIFYGTSDFGIPALEWLYANTNLKAIVTTPDMPAGRKMEMRVSPVKQWFLGETKGEAVILQPSNLKDKNFQEQLRKLNPDVALVADYGKIIPAEVLDIPKYKTLNLHVSLLPKYRGASPMQTAILNGETTSGVTLFILEPTLDTGPTIVQEKIVLDKDETYPTLHSKSAKVSADLLGKYLGDYVNGKIQPKQQNHSEATHTKLFTKEDGRIDWTKPAEEIERMVRALNPWPGVYTNLKTQNEKLKTEDKIMKIFKAEVSNKKLAPGETLIENGRIFVGTGSNALEILELQVSGGRRMSAKEFITGLRGEITFLHS